jgi:prepilin-type processing-associated H-X9-DG protein
LFGDAIWIDGWPKETEGPAKDLYKGNANTGVGRFSVARHGGAAAQSAPRNIASSSEMNGAATVAFYDGHAASVKLKNYWTLAWHDGWTAPTSIPAPK